MRTSISYVTLAFILVWAPRAVWAGPLMAIEEDTGALWLVSSTDASLTALGNTGLTGVGALALNPDDGFFYATTTGSSAALYRIDVSANLASIESVTEVGPLGFFNFEGGLAFGPDGTAYGVNQGLTVASLYTINLSTGSADVVGEILRAGEDAERHDISGLMWRSDGTLVGLDSTPDAPLMPNGLLATIDPQTAVLEAISGTMPIVGTLGGMTGLDGAAYYVTGGPGALTPGSNELWSFDPFTGEQTSIGSFDGVITGSGFSGLTVVPEPALLSLLLTGAVVHLVCGPRRRRRTKP